MSVARNSKVLKLLNYRLKITISDGRNYVGQMIAFDQYMNIVLSDCEEFRKIKPKNKEQAAAPDREEKRTLGLVILRGDIIVSMSVEAPPPADSLKKIAVAMPGIGIGRPAGRGMPIAAPVAAAPIGLSGPVPGVGGPAPGGFGGMPMPPPGFRPPPPGFRPPPPGFRPPQ